MQFKGAGFNLIFDLIQIEFGAAEQNSSGYHCKSIDSDFHGENVLFYAKVTKLF
jgi:hypothetical protein